MGREPQGSKSPHLHQKGKRARKPFFLFGRATKCGDLHKALKLKPLLSKAEEKIKSRILEREIPKE